MFLRPIKQSSARGASAAGDGSSRQALCLSPLRSSARASLRSVRPGNSSSNIAPVPNAGAGGGAAGASASAASSASTSYPIRLSVDPSGTLLAASLTSKEVQIFDLLLGDYVCTLFGHSEVVLSLFFTPDCRHLVTASADR